MNDDMHARALSKVLSDIESAMDDEDAKRLRAMLDAADDEDSESPVDPTNMDPDIDGAELDGGHAGELPTSAVVKGDSGSQKMTDPDETGAVDDDEARLRAIAKNPKRRMGSDEGR